MRDAAVAAARLSPPTPSPSLASNHVICARANGISQSPRNGPIRLRHSTSKAPTPSPTG